MASQSLEYPAPPWIELHAPVTEAERATLLALNAHTKPDDVWREAITMHRVFVIEHVRKLLEKEKVLTAQSIRSALDLAWAAAFPKLHRFVGPMIAETYLRSFNKVDAGQVPIRMVYSLAEEHARRTGEYFHSTSSDALIQGFNAYVNRRVPERTALARVIDAYGLTPRQMSGMTSSKSFEDKIESVTPRAMKRRLRNYIAKSILQRLQTFSRQESHNLNEQANQVAWMWLVEHGRLPRNAEKMWLTAQDERVCPICGPLHRTKIPIRDQFLLDDGQKLYVPGAHTNCRCTVRLQTSPLAVVQKSRGDKYNRDQRGRFAATNSGPVTERDQDYFSNERCMDLAVSLHKMTGWPIHAVYDFENGKEGWIHVGVVDPSGKFLDVFGPQDYAEADAKWADFWGEISDTEMGPMEAETARAQGNAAETPRANAVARKLLKEHYPDTEVKKADDDFDPTEHPRGSRGRFVRRGRQDDRQASEAANPPVAEREETPAAVEDIVAAAQQQRDEEIAEIAEAAGRRSRLDQLREVLAPKQKPTLEAKPTLGGDAKLTEAPSLQDLGPKPELQNLAEAAPKPSLAGMGASLQRMAGTLSDLRLSAMTATQAKLDQMFGLTDVPKVPIQAIPQEAAEQLPGRARRRRYKDMPVDLGLPHRAIGDAESEIVYSVDDLDGYVDLTADKKFMSLETPIIASSYGNTVIDQAVEDILSEHSNVIVETDPRYPDHNMYHTVDDDDVELAIQAFAHRDDPLHDDPYYDMQFVDSSGKPVIERTVRFSDLAPMMGVRPEDLEVTVYEVRRGIDGKTYGDDHLTTKYVTSVYLEGRFRVVSNKIISSIEAANLASGDPFPLPVRLVELEPVITQRGIEEEIDPDLGIVDENTPRELE